VNDAEKDLETTVNRVESCSRGFWWTTRYLQQDMNNYKDLKEIILNYNQSHIIQLWKTIKLDQKLQFEEYYKQQKHMEDPWKLKSCDLNEFKTQLKYVRALETKLTNQSMALSKTLYDSEKLLSACKVCFYYFYIKSSLNNILLFIYMIFICLFFVFFNKVKAKIVVLISQNICDIVEMR
jgi:hypothetical protein